MAAGMPVRGMRVNVECEDCGITASDLLAEGVDPEFYIERDGSGAGHCQGCLAIEAANQRFAAGDW